MAKVLDIKGTKVFRFLYDNFTMNYKPEDPQKIFILEGSSGSSKTTSIIQLIIMYCILNKGKGKRIVIARARYSWLKSAPLDEFIKWLVTLGLYKEKFHTRSHPQSYRLYGNTIDFVGLDDPQRFHGPRQDITWINEAMESDQASYDQLAMRTNEAVILDYNPSYTTHWIFDTLLCSLPTKPNTFYKKSTFRDNEFLPRGQREKILSYEPTPINITNGTANEFMWKVYGLGERASQKGIIFKYVNWVSEIPEHLTYWYGLDLGFSIDPSSLVKVAIDGKMLYAKLCLYTPTENPDLLSDALRNAGVKRFDRIIADSSDRYNDREYIKELKSMGWNIDAVSKTNGVKYWIDKLKSYTLNFVDDKTILSQAFKTEQENYRWKTINDMPTNQPEDKHNHAFDALRYAIMKPKRKAAFW
jgi:phage terminase large subunit